MGNWGYNPTYSLVITPFITGRLPGKHVGFDSTVVLGTSFASLHTHGKPNMTTRVQIKRSSWRKLFCTGDYDGWKEVLAWTHEFETWIRNHIVRILLFGAF